MSVMSELDLEKHERLERLAHKLYPVIEEVVSAASERRYEDLRSATDVMDMMLEEHGWTISLNELAQSMKEDAKRVRSDDHGR